MDAKTTSLPGAFVELFGQCKWTYAAVKIFPGRKLIHSLGLQYWYFNWNGQLSHTKKGLRLFRLEAGSHLTIVFQQHVNSYLLHAIPNVRRELQHLLPQTPFFILQILMLRMNIPLGFIYIRAKATSLLTCCIVSDLCIYTTVTAVATNIKEKNHFRVRSNINEPLHTIK